MMESLVTYIIKRIFKGMLFIFITDPKIEVFQPSQKENFGIGSQLRK